MGYFPFYIDIKDKKCVVIGGGKIALRKVEKLLPFKPSVTVVAEEVCAELADIEMISIVKRPFKDSDLDGAFMAIAAANDRDVNKHIFDLCNKKNILINCVDDKENCGFLFPALIKRENFTAAVSTEGRSPLFAKYLRGRIEEILTDDCDKTVDFLAGCRSLIKEKVPSERNRKIVFERIFEMCMTGQEPSADEVLKITEEFGYED